VTPRRLRYERPWQEHLALYRDLFADPAVARMLWPAGSAGQPPEDRGQAVLAEDIRHWQERSFGPWAFFAGDTGLFVGRGGLRTTTVAGRECVEVAYAVRSEEWAAVDAKAGAKRNKAREEFVTNRLNRRPRKPEPAPVAPAPVVETAIVRRSR